MPELAELPTEWADTGDDTEREYLIGLFSGLVELLGALLPGNTEVVFHDLARVPNSIVAIEGSLTGRSVGDTANEVRIERLTGGSDDWRLCEATLPDGRWTRSGMLTVRDTSGSPMGALCIHSDVSAWEELDRIVTSMLGRAPTQPGGGTSCSGAATPARSKEPSTMSSTTRESSFPKDLDSFAGTIVDREIAAADVPVDLMKKAHKLEVVRALKARGVFQMKGAVEQVANALGVTRFTIYNYLNEIGDGDE